MREKTKKATFNIHSSVLEAMDEVMAQGLAPSKNSLVEQALIKEIKELQKQTRQKQWREAAKDPLLIRDIENVENGFFSADSETAGGLD